MNLFQNGEKPEAENQSAKADEYRFTVGAGQEKQNTTVAAQRRTWFAGVFLTLVMAAGFASLINDALGRIGSRGSGDTASAYVIGNGGGNLLIVDAPATQQEGFAYREIARGVLPSIVRVTVYRRGEVAQIASASGVIISANGLIVTSSHILQDAEGVQVTLQDGTHYIAQIVGMDPCTDIAVLRIPAGNLVAATFAGSGNITAGEQILVIGNAEGPQSSTMWGLVSGTDKQVSVGDGTHYMELIQVGIPISVENTGGALVNMQGHVVGICSTYISNENGNGTGFAVPFTEVKLVIDELVEYGTVQGRATLGAVVVPLNEISGTLNGLPVQGLYITEVMEYSPLNGVNITSGHILLRADGQPLVTVMDLMNVLKTHKPGEYIQLTVYNPTTGKTGILECVLIRA